MIGNSTERNSSWRELDPSAELESLATTCRQLRERLKPAKGSKRHEIGMQLWGLSKTRGRMMDVKLSRCYKEHKYVITEYEAGLPWAICTCGFAHQARVDIDVTREDFLELPGHLAFPDE
jgi:hypothetical protein